MLTGLLNPLCQLCSFPLDVVLLKQRDSLSQHFFCSRLVRKSLDTELLPQPSSGFVPLQIRHKPRGVYRPEFLDLSRGGRKDGL
jgi:hypothetical protein